MGGHGLAGEFGHIVVNSGRPRVRLRPAGLRAGLPRRTGPGPGRAPFLATCPARRRRPAPQSAADIFRLARGGDQVAAGIIDQATEALAIGFAVIAAVFDPELIVIGGSVALSQKQVRPQVGASAPGRCRRHLFPGSPGAPGAVSPRVGDHSPSGVAISV